MKIVAILDFDEYPKTCKECPCHEGEGYFYCPLIHGSHGSLAWYFNGDKERNPYCPIKPMPEKKTPSVQLSARHNDEHMEILGLRCTDYEKGWNECIEELEK